MVKPIDILAIWKYVLETVIDLAGKSEKNIDDIEIQIYQYQDILRDILGTSVENNEVTIFSKEI